MTYRIAAIPMTLSDLQGHSSVAFSNGIFRTVMHQLTTFQLISRRAVSLL